MNTGDFDNHTDEQKAKIILVEGEFLSRSNFHDLEISVHQFDNRVCEIWFDTKAKDVIQVCEIKDEPFSSMLKHLRLSTLN